MRNKFANGVDVDYWCTKIIASRRITYPAHVRRLIGVNVAIASNNRISIDFPDFSSRTLAHEINRVDAVRIEVTSIHSMIRETKIFYFNQ